MLKLVSSKKKDGKTFVGNFRVGEMRELFRTAHELGMEIDTVPLDRDCLVEVWLSDGDRSAFWERFKEMKRKAVQRGRSRMKAATFAMRWRPIYKTGLEKDND